MNKYIKEVLKLFNNNGYESYVVGGYVRDFLLGKLSKDVDIATNANLKESESIIKFNNKVFENYGCIKFEIDDYNFSITTYRKEYDYFNNKPLKVENVESLKSDLLRRDFTINAICMDKDSNIIDPLHGEKDLNQKLIKMIGDTESKLKEDNTRILRALRFMSVLNFNLDDKLESFIKENRELIKTINKNTIKKELDKIFSDKNYKIFLDFIKNNNMCDCFDLNYDKVNYTNNHLGIWAQIDYKDYNFSKLEKKTIDKIRTLLNKNTITKYDIYKYGLDISLMVGDILDLNSQEILKDYANLPIRTFNELKITFNEIGEVLGTTNNTKIKEAKENLIKEVIEGRLKNEYNSLIDFLKV